MRLLKLWVAMALLYVATGAVNPLLPLYMSVRGLSDVEIGVLASTASIVSLVATLWLGYASDLVDRRNSLQALLRLAAAVVVAACIAVRGLAGFAVVYPAYAALVFSSMSLSAAVAMDYVGGGRRGAGFGAVRTSGAVGWVVGTLAGGFLSQGMGFLAAFLLSALSFLLSALLYGLGVPRLVGAGGRPHPSLLAALRSRRIMSVTLALLVAAVANPAYYTFLPLYMVQELGASRLMASLAFSVTPVAEVPAMLLLGALSDRVGRRRVMTLCLAAYPLRFALTGVLRDPILVVAVQLLHGLTFGGLYVVTTAYLTEELGVAGVASSLYPVASSLGSMLGGYLLALTLASRGFHAMYMAAAAISGLSVPLLYAPELAKRIRIG